MHLPSIPNPWGPPKPTDAGLARIRELEQERDIWLHACEELDRENEAFKAEIEYLRKQLAGRSV